MWQGIGEDDKIGVIAAPAGLKQSDCLFRSNNASSAVTNPSRT